MIINIIPFSFPVTEEAFLLLCPLCGYATGDRIGSVLGPSLPQVPGAVPTCRERGALSPKPRDQGSRAKERLRASLVHVALATRMSRCLRGNSSIKMASSGQSLPRTRNCKPQARCLGTASLLGPEGRRQRTESMRLGNALWEPRLLESRCHLLLLFSLGKQSLPFEMSSLLRCSKENHGKLN